MKIKKNLKTEKRKWKI